MREPTAKQLLFVSYYLGDAKGNATEAARLAGYRSPEIQGRQVLSKTIVRARIDARLAEVALSANEVLARLSEIAAGSLEEFLEIDAQGRYTLSLAKAKRRGKLHLLKKLKPTEYGLSVEIHDPLAALDKLARYHGLLSDLSDDALVARFKALMGAGGAAQSDGSNPAQ